MWGEEQQTVKEKHIKTVETHNYVALPLFDILFNTFCIIL